MSDERIRGVNYSRRKRKHLKKGKIRRESSTNCLNVFLLLPRATG